MSDTPERTTPAGAPTSAAFPSDVRIRFRSDGEVISLDGEWSRLLDGLECGRNLRAAAPRAFVEALEACVMQRSGRFRFSSANAEDWLCSVLDDGEPDTLVLAALVLPASVGVSREALAWVDRLTENLPFHVAVTDLEDGGRFVYWSKASERMFGYTAAEMVGKQGPRILYASENQFLAALSAAESDGFDSEVSMRRKNGETFPARVVVGVMATAQGAPRERWGVAEDLTHRVEAVALMDDVQRDAQHDDRVRLLGQLTGGIAHDFNNLLTAIVSSTEMLSLQCDDNPGTRGDLDVIRSAARSASSLTRRLLTFTRRSIEAPRVIDVPSWFAELLPFLKRLVPERVRFEHSMTGTGAVEIDPNELEQVMLNLVVNAVGAMPEGGVLALRGRCVEGRALLEVEDTGVGMPAELHEKVFDPFFTTRSEGTGLGLATARAIVRRAGGDIWLLSARDSGSCFSVSLPLSERAGAESAEVADPTQASTNRGVALLVEDQPDVRLALKRLLEAMGFEVRAVADVNAAKLEVERMETCVLLLTDYMLPDGTGLDVLPDARATFPDAPAIVMSGYIDQLESVAPKFDRLLAKPFTRSELSRLLDELGVA